MTCTSATVQSDGILNVERRIPCWTTGHTLWDFNTSTTTTSRHLLLAGTRGSVALLAPLPVPVVVHSVRGALRLPRNALLSSPAIPSVTSCRRAPCAVLQLRKHQGFAYYPCDPRADSRMYDKGGWTGPCDLKREVRGFVLVRRGESIRAKALFRRERHFAAKGVAGRAPGSPRRSRPRWPDSTRGNPAILITNCH